MNNCEFEEIIVFEDFEVKNGVLGLHQYIYLNIIEFLNSSVVRKVIKYFFFSIFYFCCDSTLELVKNHLNE
jgi:hypothetical protein